MIRTLKKPKEPWNYEKANFEIKNPTASYLFDDAPKAQAKVLDAVLNRRDGEPIELE